MDLVTVSLILLLCLFVLLGSGAWIAIALLATGFVGMQFTAVPSSGYVLATTTWGSSASWTLAALPLFIWMGEILFRSRLSEDMFRGLSPWLNRIPGRLLHVNVLGCGLFGAVSGSSTATCATIAKISLPELDRRGYDQSLSIGSLAGSGTLGLLIPPSIMMVIYAVAADVSIIQVFLAGFVPGMIVMVLYSGYIAAWALANPAKMPPADPPMPLREKLRASLSLLPCLLLIAGVFLTLVSGWATATECAAWGVAGALIIALATRTLTLSSFVESLMGATRTTCMIMLILAGAGFLSTAMAYPGIPNAVGAWVGALELSPFALIAALTAMYVLLGCVLDGISMIVLTTTVVLPMVTAAGFDLVWFGIFLVIVIEMAQVTPPVGFNLFVLQTMSGRDTLTVARAALPFFLLLVAAVAIITAFPGLVTWLPRLVFPA